jgi:hypothetical protein
VYDQWDALLMTKCDCGRDYEIQHGVAFQIVQAKGLVKK